MATKTSIKHKELLVSEILKIVKKADAQPHVTSAKVVEQLSIPVSVLTNFMENRKNLPQQYVTVLPDQNKVKDF